VLPISENRLRISSAPVDDQDLPRDLYSSGFSIDMRRPSPTAVCLLGPTRLDGRPHDSDIFPMCCLNPQMGASRPSFSKSAQLRFPFEINIQAHAQKGEIRLGISQSQSAAL
jgi:hypothetical protein